VCKANRTQINKWTKTAVIDEQHLRGLYCFCFKQSRHSSLLIFHLFICKTSTSSWLKNLESLNIIHTCLLFRICFVLIWNKKQCFGAWTIKTICSFCKLSWSKLRKIKIEIICERWLVYFRTCVKSEQCTQMISLQKH